MASKLNANPTVYSVSETPTRSYLVDDIEDEESKEEIDAQEVFDLIRSIQDPEHPLTLEQLNVAQQVHVDDEKNKIDIYFTPTLLRSLPTRFKVDIFVQPGTHSSEHQVNKQLNDKERVAAALENSHLVQVVNKCLTAQ